ncbi:MAG: YraN family protein [Candidatus Omnitrophica bacterium]|nr:YraN family protein [Candidatus Omnitrophota bacterium]
MSDNLILGNKGEDLAAGFLKENGYKIIIRNYKSKLGEVDIVAFDKDVLCFIEVKTRNSLEFGLPKEAVSPFKQRQLAKAALLFLKEKKFLNKKARFDIVSVLCSQSSPKIDLIKNAFELDESFSL